jgi:hypothetical protein
MLASASNVQRSRQGDIIFLNINSRAFRLYIGNQHQSSKNNSALEFVVFAQSRTRLKEVLGQTDMVKFLTSPKIGSFANTRL